MFAPLPFRPRFAMYELLPAAALRASLTTLAASRPLRVDADSQLELHALVSAVVDDFKTAGWQPERVIIAIKTIARDAGLPEPRVGVSTHPSTLMEHEAVIVDLVRWSIERYYNVDWPPAS